jgi:hypothetical protein
MGSIVDWQLKAVQAIDAARNMPPGHARNEALKKAGLIRRLAEISEEIQKFERPIRGKRPRKRQGDRLE